MLPTQPDMTRHKATQEKVTGAIKAAFHTAPNNGNFRLYLTSSGLNTEQDTQQSYKALPVWG